MNILQWESGKSAFLYEVVGESHYQVALKKFSGGQRRQKVTARLILDNDNSYDSKAVRVEVDGQIVGHLPKDSARAHRKKLTALKEPDAIVQTPGVIVTGKDGMIGIYLDLPIDEDDQDDDNDEGDDQSESKSIMNQTIVVNQKQSNPGCLIQLIWFLLIGWWAGQLWILLAWFFMLIILGIPIAVKMINRLPKVIALRGGSNVVTIVQSAGGMTVSTSGSAAQRPLWLRAIWFVFFGWWLSAIVMELGYFLCLTLIGLPIGFWLFDRVPTILSLRR